MKYAVILGDGMADRPVPSLGGKTPLEAAHKPNIDYMSACGELGMVKTIPDGMAPGSDTANLSVMGYAPKLYYTGRSPLEAVSMGIDLAPADRTFRCNLVTLSGDGAYAEKTMADYSAGEITTAEAAELIAFIEEKLGGDGLHFHPGISYRHCLVWKDAPDGFTLTPPHDISDRCVGEYLPKGECAARLLSIMTRSYELLRDHPVNVSRRARGLNTADSIWLWGDGTKPQLPAFKDKTGLDAAVISAVDLIKGIGRCAGMDVIEVEGATGTVDTNFDGKAAAAIKALRGGADFVYIHMEAPDECGHHGDAPGKVRSVELIDEKVAGALLREFKNEPFSVLVLPDHPTPIEIKTHCGDPVPYIIYRTGTSGGSGRVYTEKEGAATGLYIGSGPELMARFLGK